jgi:nucleolar protein 56
MRIREWYGYHFPELVKIVPDNYEYARAAKFIGAKETLTADSSPTSLRFSVTTPYEPRMS